MSISQKRWWTLRREAVTSGPRVSHACSLDCVQEQLNADDTITSVVARVELT